MYRTRTYGSYDHRAVPNPPHPLPPSGCHHRLDQWDSGLSESSSAFLGPLGPNSTHFESHKNPKRFKVGQLIHQVNRVTPVIALTSPRY